ncbi:MAG: argininosuccinate lyase [Clostridia bacterium]|nr:argininosuccinate lyase [Clostridia bacterium]
MAKMWAGRFSVQTDKLADDFNSSISFDSRMYSEDIRGSIAHAEMLGETGIVTREEADALKKGLEGILGDLDSGELKFDPECEDVHMFVEQVLTERIGDLGKKLHTARSRNDQVAVDLRMYLRSETDEVTKSLKKLLALLADKAQEGADAIMPGYTHLQRAQPVTLGQHLMAYAMMFIRDVGRLEDAKRRMNVSPLGSCALAGTTYPTDRNVTSRLLGFDAPCLNSMDGVSDRDFALELMSALSILMMHLSRFCEEIILWSGVEFGFVELSDAFTTGSSIMPQKKNPDMAELIRGKTGRVYGDLVTLLTVMKGLPLAYNKDMQEDKEAVFDAFDTVKKCLGVFVPMLSEARFRPERMLAAVKDGFINATDLADYLVGKGLPFRAAYKTVGQIVARCIADGKDLQSFSLDVYKEYSPLFDTDLYEAVDPAVCVKKRRSLGGTAPENVLKQIEYVRSFLN